MTISIIPNLSLGLVWILFFRRVDFVWGLIPFVRYADDSMIFCKSKRAAMRVKESITRFIENVLYLRVNMEKTVVSYVRGVKYLGNFFYVMKGKCQLTVHLKFKAKMKSRFKELTSRSNGWGYAKRK